MTKKHYLGDDLYVEDDGNIVVLSCDRRAGLHSLGLQSDALVSFLEFIARSRGWKITITKQEVAGFVKCPTSGLFFKSSEQLEFYQLLRAGRNVDALLLAARLSSTNADRGVTKYHLRLAIEACDLENEKKMKRKVSS